jgi:hypothetical protein
MPNKVKRYKRGGAATRRGHVRTSRKGDSVKALLERRTEPALARICQQSARQDEWREWLRTALSADAVAHLSGVVERGDTLIVFTESAAWSARIRYAVAEIEASIRVAHPRIAQVRVRVLPRS